MANLKQAVEYASQNPDSPFAKNLEQLMASGSLDQEAQKYGIDTSVFKPKETIVNKLGTDLKKRGSDLVTAVSDVGAKVSQAQTLPEVGSAIGRGLLRTGGAVAGGVSDVINTGIVGGAKAADTALGNVPSQAIKAGGQAFLATETGKKALQALQGGMQSFEIYKASNPEAAKDLENAIDIASAIPLVKGVAKVTGGAVDIAKIGVSNTAKSAEGVIGKLTTKTPEAAINNFQRNLLEQIEGKKVTKNELLSKKTDVLDTIAKDPRYHPEVDAENKRFKTDAAIKNINTDITEIADVTNNLFKEADAALGGVPTQDVISTLKTKLFDVANAPKFVVLGKQPFKEAETLLKRLAQTYGDAIPRADLWGVRKAVDNAVNAMADTNLKKELRQDVRKAFETTLEGSLGENNTLVKQLMGEMQKRIEARDYLEKTLNAATITGGKLTDIIRNATASGIGSTVGAGLGGVAGGVPGAVAGYAVSSQIGKWLAKNTLTSPLDRKALEGFVKSKPEIFKEVKNYINGLKGVEKTKAAENLKAIAAPVEVTAKATEAPKVIPALAGLPASAKVDEDGNVSIDLIDLVKLGGLGLGAYGLYKLERKSLKASQIKTLNKVLYEKDYTKKDLEAARKMLGMKEGSTQVQIAKKARAARAKITTTNKPL